MSTMDKIKAKVENVVHPHGSTHSTETAHTTGTAHTGSYTGNTSGIGDGQASSHSPRTANAADPRVDSDRDHRGATGVGSGTTHTPGARSSGLTGSTGNTYNSNTNTTAGPHDPNMANKLDPRDRVDSNRDGRAAVGNNTHSFGSIDSSGTGYNSNTTGTTHNAGPHNSSLANKADPRVDSDLDGRGNTGASGSYATPGSGTAQNTAGPHNRDFLNKADPRVDADLDGSKTLGGNRTHA